MIKTQKVDVVTQLREKLEVNPNFIVTSFEGLTVKSMEDLRKLLKKATGSELKVIKNNLFLRALKESQKHPDKSINFGNDYHGAMAAVFSDENLPSVAKVCKEFKKTNDKFELKFGYLDGEVLDSKGVEAIAGLPSKEELLAQIARSINSPAQSVASAVNQVMASLARAIQAVAEKKNNG
ncbi:MAG: 50S ribosomal protein L10 [Leptospiraceae bacterium]|nr:50S ribosomal protein L10 [Leptospiraceae bacterium]MCP5495902.1 50S ribosomal protein L10 [Leptospiraceae bacterium]